MHVVLISTVGHNPGDDFIRFGQQHLLTRLATCRFSVVHKHDPRTVFDGFVRRRRTPHRLVAPMLYRIYSTVTRSRNLLAAADLVVFAGTPFIWKQSTGLFPSTSANAEWVGPTWSRLMTDFPHTPVLNLAAGSSINANQQPSAILRDRDVAAFLRRALQRATLTTARDRLTASILAELGPRVPVLPCTSLWAAAGARLEARTPKYVAVNVMREAVHAGRGKPTAGGGWRATITEVVHWLAEHHRVRLLCHSADEWRVARAWFPQHEATFPSNATELLEAYGGALYTVSNRVHGAAGAASFGRPAIGIGGDSRIELLREFRLPALNALDVTAEGIVRECERLESDYDRHVAQLRQLASDAEAQYMQLLQVSLRGAGVSAE